MTEHIIAWAAGVLEGEGSFYLGASSPCRRASLKVYVEMRDADVIARLRDVFTGAGKLSTRKRVGIIKGTHRVRDSHSIMYTTAWHGQHAEALMRAVLPYMGERRSAKIRECLDTPNLSHYSRQKEAV